MCFVKCTYTIFFSGGISKHKFMGVFVFMMCVCCSCVCVCATSRDEVCRFEGINGDRSTKETCKNAQRLYELGKMCDMWPLEQRSLERKALALPYPPTPKKTPSVPGSKARK